MKKNSKENENQALRIINVLKKYIPKDSANSADWEKLFSQLEIRFQEESDKIKEIREAIASSWPEKCACKNAKLMANTALQSVSLDEVITAMIIMAAMYNDKPGWSDPDSICDEADKLVDALMRMKRVIMASVQCGNCCHSQHSKKNS
jgi:hypothetical protein